LQADAWQTKSGDDEFYKLNTKVTGVEWTNFYFCWNINTPYFSDKRVRQAMSYAYNYDEMLTHVLYGLYDRCNGPFHPDAWMAPKELPAPYTQNLDKAEQLLDEAG